MNETLRPLSLNTCRMFLFGESILVKSWTSYPPAGKLFSPLNGISSEPSFDNTKSEAIDDQ